MINVTGKRLEPRRVCPAWSRMCVLDSVQGTFCNMRPDDFESMYSKAGDSEAKGLLKIEAARSPDSSKSRLGCLDSGEEVTVTEVSHTGPRGLK